MKKLILIFFAIAFSSLNIVFAGPLTYEKIGNEFTSTSGSYATSAHCTSGAGQTCSWISGNQIIIGAYDANPSTWAGSATWTFDLTEYIIIIAVGLILTGYTTISKKIIEAFKAVKK